MNATLPGNATKEKRMLHSLRTAIATALSVARKHSTALGAAIVAMLWTAATLGNMAHASSTPATAIISTPWGNYDVVNAVAGAVYPLVIPCITVGAIVFAAFWIYHRVRGAL